MTAVKIARSNGAAGENRTLTGLPPRDFESRVYTSFTTAARTLAICLSAKNSSNIVQYH